MDNGLQSHTGDESLVILQSLLCLLREKNVLSRADPEPREYRGVDRSRRDARRTGRTRPASLLRRSDAGSGTRDGEDRRLRRTSLWREAPPHLTPRAREPFVRVRLLYDANVAG